jgi:hypothetical protein
LGTKCGFQSPLELSPLVFLATVNIERVTLENTCKDRLGVQAKVKVLLTVHHCISVQWNQCDALFFQFIENQGPLHVSSITCSSSGGATQTEFGILRAYNVKWLWHGCNETAAVPHPTDIIRTNIPNAVCVSPPEDKQVMLETCRGPWLSINWMKRASRWFHYTEPKVS